MNLKQALKFITKDTAESKEQVHISMLEQQILQDVTQVTKKTMKNTNTLYPFARFRLRMSQGLAFSLFLIAMAGIFGFIKIQNTNLIGEKKQNNSITVIKSVSAEEVITNTQKAIDSVDKIYYKIRQSGVAYSKDLPSGGSTGVMVDDGVMRTWYDFKTKNSRSESELDGVLWTFITRNNSNGYTTNYEFLPDRSIDDKGEFKTTKKGIFAKTVYKTPPQEELQQFISDRPHINQNENPKVTFEKMLKQFKGQSNTKFENVEEGGRRYYKLSIEFPYDENSQFVTQTGYVLLIEQDTYFPYKETKIYENGKGKIEYTFEEVKTDFNDDIFTDAVFPEGYSRLENGKLQIPSPYSLSLKKCSSELFNKITSGIKESCTEGVYGVYDLIASEYTDGKVSVEIGHTETGLFNEQGRTIQDLKFKLYVSKETFATEDEAIAASKVEFEELQKAPAGFIEKRKPAIKPWRKVRMDVYDAEGKKLYESESAVDTKGVEEVG